MTNSRSNRESSLEGVRVSLTPTFTSQLIHFTALVIDVILLIDVCKYIYKKKNIVRKHSNINIRIKGVLRRVFNYNSHHGEEVVA